MNHDQLKILIALLILLITYYLLIGQHLIRALLSGVRLSNSEILFMHFRKTSVKKILDSLIKSHKAGILLQRDELEALYLAGGNLDNVVEGLIFAKNKGISMDFAEASKLDLQQTDVVKYLRNKHITL